MNIGTNYYYSLYSKYSTLFNTSSSIFGTSKSSKLYSPFNKEDTDGLLGSGALKYISDIKTSSKNLKNALTSLSAGTPFARKNAVSSNIDALTVNSSGSKFAASSSPVSVNIDQVATGQINEGAKLNSDDNAGIKGQQQFTVETGGKTAKVSINASESDTNNDIQRKMADAINKAGLGLYASVITDEQSNTSMLKIESSDTGENAKNKFTIKDESGGDIIAKLGAADVKQTAKDAVFTVNGGAKRTSASNTVDLGGGLNVTLKKAGSVSITGATDTASAKSRVEDMVNSYNDLYAAAVNNSSDPKASKLFSKLVNNSKVYSSTLASIGVGFDDDGRMKINDETFTKAAESGKLERFFTENNGKNYGFTHQLSKLAGEISNNTSNYVSKSAVGDYLTSNFSYSSFGDIIQYNYLSAGSVFDYLF